MDFLADMARLSRERVAKAQQQLGFAQLWQAALAAATPPPLQPVGKELAIIAEVKWRSPAVGQLRTADENIAARVHSYASAGAAAVSVLTEPERFDGSLEHLKTASQTLRPFAIPAMRKDFLVDPYQIAEARVAGAGGVLLILRMIPQPQLHELIQAARALGLFMLLEAFDETDLQLARELLARHCTADTLVGVNSRDLVSLQVVPERLLQLAPHLPSEVPCVAESGVATAEQAYQVARAGYRYALIGSALMQAADPGALLQAMRHAGAS
jgi:indole-3-glycerol phosphate synthase